MIVLSLLVAANGSGIADGGALEFRPPTTAAD